MLAKQLTLNSTQINHKTIDDLCLWIDLINVSGLDHLTLQSEFSKQKLMTPMTWIRKRKEAMTGRNLSSVAPNRYASLLAHSSN